MCGARGLPHLRIGVTDDVTEVTGAGPDEVEGPGLAVQGLFTVALDELAAAHRGTLPALFG